MRKGIVSILFLTILIALLGWTIKEQKETIELQANIELEFNKKSIKNLISTERDIEIESLRNEISVQLSSIQRLENFSRDGEGQKQEIQIEYKMIKKEELLNLIKDSLGVVDDVEIRIEDKFIYFPDKEIMDEIIRKDRTNELPYRGDGRDCENFGLIFSSHMSEDYGLNNAGWLNVYEEDGKRHALNIILVEEEGKKKLYAFEPQNDEMIELQKFLEKNEYKIEEIIWY